MARRECSAEITNVLLWTRFSSCSCSQMVSQDSSRLKYTLFKCAQVDITAQRIFHALMNKAKMSWSLRKLHCALQRVTISVQKNWKNGKQSSCQKMYLANRGLKKTTSLQANEQCCACSWKRRQHKSSTQKFVHTKNCLNSRQHHEKVVRELPMCTTFQRNVNDDCGFRRRSAPETKKHEWKQTENTKNKRFKKKTENTMKTCSSTYIVPCAKLHKNVVDGRRFRRALSKEGSRKKQKEKKSIMQKISTWKKTARP